MGRGRAKAKQTKVARQLKYSSPTMDLDALQRELGSAAPRNDAEDDYVDPYAADVDDEDEAPQRRYR